MKGSCKRHMLLCAAVMSLAGCHHRDVTDTAASWWHSMEGGEIAKLRPPPPGAHDPYPHVGLTPTTPPSVPSPPARQSITEALVEQRNYTHLMDAKDGPLVVIPPQIAPPAKKPPAAPADNIASASLDAAGQDDTPPPATNTPAAAVVAPVVPPKPAVKTKPVKQPDPPETAMPAVVDTQLPAVPTAPGDLPQIPAGPPDPPQFPGFDVPTDASVATQAHPDYQLADPPGELVRFEVGSDQLVPGQDKTLNKLVVTGQTHVLSIHGYGAAAGMAPAEQAHATELALLRAQALAEELVKRGVAAGRIVLTGEAFGQDVRVTS